MRFIKSVWFFVRYFRAVVDERPPGTVHRWTIRQTWENARLWSRHGLRWRA